MSKMNWSAVGIPDPEGPFLILMSQDGCERSCAPVMSHLRTPQILTDNSDDMKPMLIVGVIDSTGLSWDEVKQKAEEMGDAFRDKWMGGGHAAP